jgi:hypothetical protein
MNRDLNILIPVRNPTEVILDSVRSLIRQNNRSFSVLLSDNYSNTGVELIDQARNLLNEAGITCELLQPPSELGRVEHWNWLHYQSKAEWLKPLFAGDWLEEIYISRVFELRKRYPECRYFYSSYHYHKKGEEKVVVPSWAGALRSRDEMRLVVARHGMQFGPPSAACYHRDLFYQHGAYNPMIPICADSYLFCQLAAAAPSYGFREALCHFHIHDSRFSTDLDTKTRKSLQEGRFYATSLAAQSWLQRWKVPPVNWVRRLVKLTLGR